MKLYFMVALMIVAIHVGSASDMEASQYECPETKHVIPCPHPDPSRCAVYCMIPSLNQSQKNRNVFGFYCYNTHPPVFCPVTNRFFCMQFCKGAAKAMSLPIAGQEEQNSNV